jgi:5-formyltetrahydrofolate cyclo-ligase
MDKKELRRLIREQKRTMTREQIDSASQRLAQLLFETDLYKNASVLYGYMPYNQEVNTLLILERALRDGKRVAVPKVYGDTMNFIYLEDLSQVAPSSMGIPEPIADEPIARDERALVLMPGLAFDKAGNRMGYGGGYYDKFLAAEPTHPTVALCYDFQLVDTIPTDVYDIPVDLVIVA